MDDEDDGTHVRAPTLEDLARICEALNRAGARYVLIGGFAVITHGGGRTTKDIDFLIDSSPANVARVKEALSILPDNAAAEIAETDIETYTVVRVADECGIATRNLPRRVSRPIEVSEQPKSSAAWEGRESFSRVGSALAAFQAAGLLGLS